MKYRIEFSVHGKTLWDLDHAVWEKAEQLVGSLVDQHGKYRMRVSPGQLDADNNVTEWRGEVVLHIKAQPDVVVFNEFKHPLRDPGPS